MAGKVVTTAAPTKQEAAAVRNYVGKTAKANPGTSRAVEKVGSDARNVNYYRGAADPESKKKKNEAREAAQRDRNLASRMEGNGQQAQTQQEAQQKQQEQTQESKFSDEANKGKGQTEQQEQNKYTQEANSSDMAKEQRFGRGNIDLLNRDTGLYDTDGNLMTVRSMSFGEDGKEILIPTIVNDNGKWKQLTDDEAIDWYHKTGEYLGKFNSVDEANSYAEKLHRDQENLYVKNQPADPAKTLAETAEGNPNGDDAQKGSAWAKQRADEASTELADLQADRLRVSELYQNGEPPSEQTLQALGLKTLEEYDDEIGKAEWKADYFKKLAETGATDTERNELLEQYNAANDEFETYAGYATDPLTAAAMGGQEARVEDLEGQLKEKNRELGNTSYTGLADYARGKDFVENWQGERGAQYGAALGTAAEWLGDKINNTSYTVTDPETGEEREVWNLAGKGDALKDWGADVFQSSKALNEEAQQDWADVTEGMSAGEQQALGMAKTFGNTAEDAVVNLMTLGLGGKVLMGARAAGSGALTQDERDANDLDSRMTKAILDGGVAYLTEWLVGGAEGAYGKSVLGGKITDSLGKVITNPTMRKILFNTEGLEEGLEYALGYMGDRMLELDPNAEWSRSELAQNVAVGYLMGCVFNGLADAKEITGPQLRAKVDESLDMTQQVMEGKVNLPDVMEKTMRTPSEDVVIKPGKADANVEAEAETAAPEATAPEGETPAPVRAVQPEMDETGVAWTGDWDSWVDTALSGGAISETDVNTIYSKPEARRAFEEITGTSLEGMTEEEAKSTVGMAAGTTTRVEPVTDGNTAPEAEGNTEAEAPQPDEAATLAGTAEGQNPNAETTAPENGAETLANTAEGQSGVNSPTNAENAVEGGLNRTETNEGSNPPAAAAEGGQNTGNQTGNAEGGEGPNPIPGRVGPNGYQDPATTGSGPERVSEHHTNILTRREGEDVRAPVTYLAKSDLETMTNAVNRLAMNREGEVAALLGNTMWTDEQVKMGKMVGQELLAEARKTGDFTAYDAWRKIETEHGTAIARALRAHAESGAPDSSERVRQLSQNYLDLLEEQNIENEAKGKPPVVDPDLLSKTRKTVNDLSTEIAGLEAEEADLKNQGMSEEEAFGKVKDRYLDLAQKLVAERNMGLLWDDLLGRNKALRNGATDVQTRLRRMLSNRSPEYIKQYVHANQGGVATDLQYKQRPTMKQAGNMVSSFQSMCMLFGSGTFFRNTESNIVFGGLNTLSNVSGSAVDALIGAASGQRTRGLRMGVLSPKAWSAFREAGARSVLEIAANMDMREDGKYIAGTQAFSPYSPVTRIIARANQLLSYSLNTSDAVVYGMTQQATSDAAMRVGQKSGMTAETAQKIGEAEADYATFKNDTVVTKSLEGVQRFLDVVGFGGEVEYFKGTHIPKGRKGGFGLGQFFAKFVKVPANIKTKGAEFSPLGIVTGTAKAVKAAQMAKNSSPNSQARQDSMILQSKASGEIGRGITGTALVLALAAIMKKAKEDDREWFKDWDQEENPDVKTQNKAEGKQGQQINFSMLAGDNTGKWQNGDTAVDISSNEPMNQLLTMASALANDEDSPTLDAYLDAFKTGMTENLADMPCVETFSTYQSYIDYNKVYDTTYEEDEEGNLVEHREENTGKTIGNAAMAAAGSAAGGFVFAPIRHIAAVTDEYQRDTKGSNVAETALNQVKNSIPVLRQTLPVKTDNYGNPVRQGDVGTRLANTYLANRYSQVNQSDVSREAERLRDATGEVVTPPRAAPKTVTFGSGDNKRTVDLSGEEGKAWTGHTGKEYETDFRELMDSPVYQLLDDDGKAAMLKTLQKYEKDGAKTELGESRDIDFESKYADYRELEDPVEVLAAQTAYSTAKKDEDWDAVDTLLKTIQRGDGRISEEGMDFMIGKDSKINYYTYLADKGVPTKRAKAFEEDLKELYTSEKRNDSRSTDMIRVAGNGKYTEKEADAIMGYEREVSDESRQRYQDQLAWSLEKAGKSGMYNEVWSRIEAVETGDMENADFKKWVDKNIPLEQRKAVKDIASNLAEDRHAAGKYVSSFYGAAREIGCTPEQALQFFEHIDSNYNGSYTKKEIRNAVKWAFGSGQNAKDVTAYLKERGIL